MESAVPNAIRGTYKLTLDQLADYIENNKEKKLQQSELIERLENELKNMTVSAKDWNSLRSQMPTWRDVFLTADTATKRVLVNRLIERIEITDEQVNIRFKINLNNFLTQPRINNDGGVPESGL